MRSVDRRDRYIKGNQELISKLVRELDQTHIEYLSELIYYGGYGAVRGQIIQSVQQLHDRLLISSDEDFNKLKLRYSAKRWACLIMWTIWELYYSPLMIELTEQENYFPFIAAELGARFFAAHSIMIDYWPFEDCENPFQRHQTAVETHCYMPLKPENS